MRDAPPPRAHPCKRAPGRWAQTPAPAWPTTPLGAYAIGLVHGMGGSAGVGLVLLAEIQRRVVAMTALAVLALFTAVSM